MSKSTNTSIRLGILTIGIAIIQLLDILLHAATNQLEFIRVSSNLIILFWLASAVSGRFSTKPLATAASFVGIYLILNIIFLAREGLTNAEQGGGLRTTLFLFMFLTMVLSSLLAFIHSRKNA